MLPAGAPAIGPSALAYALYTQGQHQWHAMKVGNQDASFNFTSEETTDDSRQLLEIDVRLPDHASGKTIVLRASIVEGLLQATHNLMSRGSLDISAVPALQSEDAQLYIEHVIDHRTVHVDRLTEVHRGIISGALQDFERTAEKLRRSSPPKT